MPCVLTNDALTDVCVPAGWKAAVRDLARFICLEEEIRQLDTPSKRKAHELELHALHERLLSESPKLIEPRALEDQTLRDDVELFARATLMWLRLRECVAADRAYSIDTLGLESLHQYQPDVPTCHRQLLRVRHALEAFPELSPTDLKQIEAEVEEDVDAARRKKQVVDALRMEFQLDDEAEQRNNLFRFFDCCYPNSGLVPAEVEMILTGAMIFFCIPYVETELQTPRFQSLGIDEQNQIRSFLKRVGKFSHWQFAHFPVFGFFRGDQLPTEMLDRLASHSGLTAETVTRELSRLIAIVPLQEADKFVVHDVWGHGWQASMLHFDRQYETLASYADAPTSEIQTETANGSTLRWEDCFKIDGEAACLDKAIFETFVTNLIHQRIAPAMTPVIAELLADVIESKLVGPSDEESLISNTSKLPDFPSKLDLMLQDLKFYFRQPTKAFRLWAASAKRRKATIAELVARGASELTATEAVEQAVEQWKRLEATYYAPICNVVEQGDTLVINLFTRLALNFLGVHRAMIEAWSDIEPSRLEGMPMQSCRDLQLMLAAVFFEAAPARNLWRIDEFLSLRTRSLCERLIDHINA